MIKLSKKRIFIVFLSVSLLINIFMTMPAWLLGTMISHYSGGRIITSNETGTFWNGNAIVLIQDSNKKSVPLINVGWKLKIGLSRFIEVDFSSSNHGIAEVALTKSGLEIDKLNMIFDLDQLTPFWETLSNLRLSGNINAEASKIVIANKMQGAIKLKITEVGSGMSPVNPIGNYNVTLNLGNSSLEVSSVSDSTIDVSGTGSIVSGLTLKAKVQPDKKEKLLQFMTMMSLPKQDGSYSLKVF